jgi:hypothetical protein
MDSTDDPRPLRLRLLILTLLPDNVEEDVELRRVEERKEREGVEGVETNGKEMRREGDEGGVKE